MHVTYKYKGQRSVLLPSTPWVTGTELSPTPLPTEPLTSPVISVLIIVLPPPPPRIPGHKCGFTLVSQGWRMNPGPRESVLFTFYKTCSLWFHLRNAAVPQDGLFSFLLPYQGCFCEKLAAFNQMDLYFTSLVSSWGIGEQSNSC